MSDHPGDEQLRQAFQALAENQSGECTPQDLDLIWRAVSGELPPAQRRELVDRLARDPACAEAWRVASELRQAAEGQPKFATRDDRVRSWSPSWLAAAAVVLLAVGAGLVVRFTSQPGGELRDGGDVVVESLVAPETTLPREAFALRWTAGPAGSRYQVRVTTEDLDVLASAADLTTPELVVPPERFATVRPGTRVLWQVDVALPDGQTVSSGTFTVRVD